MPIPHTVPRTATLPTAAELPPAWSGLHKQFMVFLRVECGLSPNTLDAYGRDLASLMHRLTQHAVRTPAAITPRHLSQHLAALKTDRELSGTSIIRHMASIKVFCRWLAARGGIPEDPSDVLERPLRS